MDPVAATESTAVAAEKKKSTGAGREIYLALVWLGTSVYATHAELKGSSGGLSGVLGSAAAALPGLVAGTMITGLTIGAAVASRYRNPFARFAVGLGAGVLFGAVTGVGLRFAYGSAESITVLAVVAAAASVAGGILAALPEDIVEAALWAATWVFFAGVIGGVLQPNVTNALGGGPTDPAGAQLAAATRFTWGLTILTGIIGGVYAYRNLRNDKPGLLTFALAGGLPGLVLLVSEGLTRLGGASLERIVHVGGDALVPLSDDTRLRNAVVIRGVGAVVAAIGGIRARAAKD
jgi:hypothetical protein